MRVEQYKTLQVDENIKIIIKLTDINEKDLENQDIELDKMQKKVKAFDDIMKAIEDKSCLCSIKGILEDIEVIRRNN